MLFYFFSFFFKTVTCLTIVKCGFTLETSHQPSSGSVWAEVRPLVYVKINCFYLVQTMVQ